IPALVSMQETPFVDMWMTKEHLAIIRQLHEGFQSHLLDPIEKGIAMGIFADVDPRLATESINGMLAWLPRWFRPKGRLNVEEVSHQVSRLVIRGLYAR